MALGGFGAILREMTLPSTIVARLVLCGGLARFLATLDLEMANLATDSTRLLTLVAICKDVCGGAAAVALGRTGASACNVACLAAIVANFACHLSSLLLSNTS